MLIGTGDPQNLFAVICGAVFVASGLAVFVRRKAVASFMASMQSQFGSVGRRVAKESQPWVYAMVGLGAASLGLLLLLAGLFIKFLPPGTPI